jgi:hypothetical protein
MEGGGVVIASSSTTSCSKPRVLISLLCLGRSLLQYEHSVHCSTMYLCSYPYGTARVPALRKDDNMI